MFYIDSHFHLQDERFSGEREKVIEKAVLNNVKGFLVPFDLSEDKNFNELLELKEKYDNFFLAAGVHPHNAKLYSGKIENKLLKLLDKGIVSLIGEIGLDYYYNYSSPQIQKSVFKAQIEIALEYNVPVVLHIRDAFEDIKRIIFGKNIKGVLHSYTGDVNFLKEALNFNFYVSFSGMITFKKAEHIRESLRATPLEKLLFETDSPYLAPHPFRGKRNEPSYVVYVYRKAAEWLRISEEELLERVYLNFFNFIGIDS